MQIYAMSLMHYYILEHHTRLGVWNIEEDEQFFIEKLKLSASEWEYAIQKYSFPHRRLEWLAGQYLLHMLSGFVEKPEKDIYGKPIFSNYNWHLSVSHSQDRTASIISPKVNGIDIQLINPKIERLYPKFMSKQEQYSLAGERNIEHISVFWGAKEALYKAYGKRDIDFRLNMIVNTFELDFDKGITDGYVIKDDIRIDFNIFYKKLENYILVYAIEK
jgi:4'-phosphopantetheinyl transferase